MTGEIIVQSFTRVVEVFDLVDSAGSASESVTGETDGLLPLLRPQDPSCPMLDLKSQYRRQCQSVTLRGEPYQ